MKSLKRELITLLEIKVVATFQKHEANLKALTRLMF